jgi:hypothetical protein
MRENNVFEVRTEICIEYTKIRDSNYIEEF